MTNWGTALPGLVCVALSGLICSAFAASVSDYAVRMSATVQTNPPRITLSWPADPTASYCELYRKSRDAAAWGTEILLAASATNYVDTNVAAGGAYEYFVYRATPAYNSCGYIYAGIEVPLVESRGKVILLVDSSLAAGLTLPLASLQQDLAGDGWLVLRHDVARMTVDPANTSTNVWAARSNELASVKALITADYNAYSGNVKAVFILGHVPVPYSGDLYPDGHTNHRGAWPADAFYGDANGSWTDSSVTSTNGSSRTWNVPGDGKFDQTTIPSNLELQVGRVDFANLQAFPQGETALLRRYLTKDHNFRYKLITAQRRGLIDDHFGTFNGEAFAANGWRDFAAFFGATNTFTGDWLPTLSSQSYLWGYGCGGGSASSAAGIASTSELVTNDPRVVFTMLFGSYFGDWDLQNNLLRASLATPTYTLTSAWVGRPFWFQHHMGLGETIGFSTRVSQNDDGTLYSDSGSRRFVHIALMGDPTLRLHPVAPPTALVVATNGAGGVDLSWNPSPDTPAGYRVYRAPTAAGPFTVLTNGLIGGTSYTDPVVTSSVYMVRAVKLEVSASGSYYNSSQGIFQSLDPSTVAPTIALAQPTNNAAFIAATNIQLLADTFDPALCITNVEFHTNGVKLGETAGPQYSLTWSNVAAGDYALLARAMCSGGWVTNSSTVTLRVRPLLTITANNTNKVYGAPLPAFTAAYSGFVNGDTPADLDSPPKLNTPATATSRVGTYPINVSGAADAYYLITYASGTLTVDKASLTVAADNLSRLYGATNPPFTAGYSGFVAGENAGVLSGSPALVSTAETNSPVGSYDIVVSQGNLSATNYAFSFTNGTLTVDPATLTVAADNKSRIYGAPDPAFTAMITGFVNGEDASVLSGSPALSTTATASSSVAGSPYEITPAADTLSASNYAFAFANGGLTITPADSTMTVIVSANPSPTGSQVTFTAILSPVSPGAGTPRGSVQFIIDGSAYGALAPVSGGVASLETALLSHGTHTVWAEFAGDGNFYGSTNSLITDLLVNSPPIPGDDRLGVLENETVNLTVADLLANDFDADQDPLTITALSAMSTNGGSVSLAGTAITYVPVTNYVGADSFSYTVSDGYTNATGTVWVTLRSSEMLTTERLPDGTAQITFIGIPGRTYCVQAATNLAVPDWKTLGTNAAGIDGLATFTDLEAGNHQRRYYRAAEQ